MENEHGEEDEKKKNKKVKTGAREKRSLLEHTHTHTHKSLHVLYTYLSFEEISHTNKFFTPIFFVFRGEKNF